MHPISEKNRRKSYMHKGRPFVLPRSTAWRLRRVAWLPQQPASGNAEAPLPREPRIDPVPTGCTDCLQTEDLLGSTSAAAAPPCHPACQDEAQTNAGVPNVPLADDEPSRDEPPLPSFFDSASAFATCLDEYGNDTLPSSTTTKAMAIVLIMAFVVAHNLPWTALDDLLRLIDALFGSKQALLPTSKYLFRKLWAEHSDKCAQRHYYCDACGGVQTPTASNGLYCHHCKTTTSQAQAHYKGRFFTIFDIKEQIRHIISKTKDSLGKNLMEIKNKLLSSSNVITDIVDGKVYRNLWKSGALSFGDLTIMFNTDGSPIYKSSNVSVWPIQFIVNELPTGERFQHAGVGGLWFGAQHPDMLAFLDKFVDCINSIGTLTWQHASGTVQSKVHVICCSVDSPARALVCNQNQFNGQFGCQWCLAFASRQEGAYRYLGKTPSTARSSQGVLANMKLALSEQVPVNGLKGLSPLVNLPGYDLVRGQAVEYMHSVLLGVSRQVASFWFDTSNSNKTYYIGCPPKLSKVVQRLTAIKPPDLITRLPRSIRERSYWKATEWKHWLLYYSLPCCIQILPHQYWSHFALLVAAVFTLLSDKLTAADIAYAAFTKECGFKHVTLSPRYSHINGLTGAAAKVIKGSLENTGNAYTTLLAYRTIPYKNGYSPAELVMGRRFPHYFASFCGRPSLLPPGQRQAEDIPG
ncbi:uncharacterized protein LOC144145692 [Haemaphysalis longicornis]